MKTVFLLLLLLLSLQARAQLTDDFSDGDFTSSPTWSGTSADFIVNTSNELQISNTVAATSYLSTPHGMSTLDGQEWHFTIRQTFAPSTSNYGRVYLTAATADLSTNPDGFYLQFGESGSTDAVRLFKSVGGVSTQICAGSDGQIAASFAVGVRVLRDNSGNWELYIDPNGGTNYGTAYTGTDATVLLGSYFGVLGVYTVSNATKFYYDNVYAGAEIVDTQAPSLISASAISSTQVDLLFSEAVGGAGMTQSSNYSLNPSISIQSVTIDGTNSALVHLTVASTFTNGQTYNITVLSSTDLSGNSAVNLNANFTYLVGETAVKGDIIINEFFADPTPVVGLAEVEFVEIYNKSTKYIDLTGWKLGDASADGTIVSGFISPGQYRILCASSAIVDYPTALTVTSFPSLNNASDDLVLKDPSLIVIDKVSYIDTWYNDPVKQDGGYTLELINPYDPCSDANNWTASNALSGGTPGTVNSIYDITPDAEIPYLIAANALAPNSLELVFSEGMDSTSLVNALLSSNPTLTLQSLVIPNATPSSILVNFNENLTASQLYTFTYTGVADCWLNATTISGNFALAETPAAGDLVINELLFDPGTGGSDFVELYNQSSKVLNLKDYSLANFDNDTIDNLQTISNNYTLFPGEYIVLTADSVYQKNQFIAAVPGSFYQMTLPSLNNDSSTVYLLHNGIILDKVSYKASWHFALLDATENKTLERINPAGISNSASNWHTAAETIGFGTPGGKNSQFQTATINGDFGTTENIFSPDNDGFQDVLQFYYQLSQPGMLATLKIYDDQGRLIKSLFRSELMDLEGTFTWDGVNDNTQKAPLGIYIAVLEAFSIDGTANFSKRTAFTLGGKLD